MKTNSKQNIRAKKQNQKTKLKNRKKLKIGNCRPQRKNAVT